MVKIYFIALATVAVVSAASPVGEVLSSKSFELSGAAVPAGGVASWPILAGDTIATKEAPARINFRDGSSVVLARGSRVVVENESSKLRVRLVQGSLSYAVKPDSNLVVSALKLPSIPSNFADGMLSVINGSAYASLAAQPRALTPASPVVITPFNLGYLQQLQAYDPATGGTPPPPPPANLVPNPSPIGAVSPIQ